MVAAGSWAGAFHGCPRRDRAAFIWTQQEGVLDRKTLTHHGIGTSNNIDPVQRAKEASNCRTSGRKLRDNASPTINGPIQDRADQTCTRGPSETSWPMRAGSTVSAASTSTARRPAGRTRGCLLRSTPETSRRLIRESPTGRFAKPAAPLGSSYYRWRQMSLRTSGPKIRTLRFNPWPWTRPDQETQDAGNHHAAFEPTFAAHRRFVEDAAAHSAFPSYRISLQPPDREFSNSSLFVASSKQALQYAGGDGD